MALRSLYQDLGLPMKIEIQSDSSAANSLTDRLGAGQRTQHIDTWYFWFQNEFKMETSVSRRCLQRRTAQMFVRSQSLLQYYNNIESLQDWYSTDHGSHTPLQDDDEPVTELVTELQHRNRQLSTSVVNIETDLQSRVKPLNGGRVWQFPR